MAIADFQSRLQRALQPARDAPFDDEAIDDYGQVLGAGDVCGRDFLKQQGSSVEAQMAVAGAIDRGEDLLGRLVCPLAARRENHQAGPVWQAPSRFARFLKAMRLYAPATGEAAGPTDAGKEQAQQLV